MQFNLSFAVLFVACGFVQNLKANQADAAKMKAATDKCTKEINDKIPALIQDCQRQQQPKKACVDPWNLGPDGMCVQYFKIGKSWQQARDHCRSLGTGIDLVNILNDQQNAWVLTTSGGLGGWIGANDLEGQYKWSSNGNAISFAKWDQVRIRVMGSPGGTYENCVYLSGDSIWYDTLCSTPACNFFCQMQI